MPIIAPHRKIVQDDSLQKSHMVLRPDMPICQLDLPLDFYQEEFKPYAEEYLNLPEKTPNVVLPWMDSYIKKALHHFGDQLMLLAHFYMGGEIVKLVERYGGKIADSYVLAKQALIHPNVNIFVESAVHFMAETIALLAHEHQQVWITNPKSGCTMEMLAKEDMVSPACEELINRYGDDLLVICYMNTGGRLKAIAGKTGGAVCTSSNASTIMKWALTQNKKIFFIPDRHLGENAGRAVGISPENMFLWPGGWDGSLTSIAGMTPHQRELLDQSKLILWGSFCGVHTIFQPRHVRYWHERGYKVLVHPECPSEIVSIADGNGSTSYLWKQVLTAAPHSKIAIGTEAHFVKNARELAKLKDIDVVHLADVRLPGLTSVGCGCATMSRNDPPHLVALLDLLVKGSAPKINLVYPGDVVNETTGSLERLDDSSRREVIKFAQKALEKMIELTEAARKD